MFRNLYLSLLCFPALAQSWAPNPGEMGSTAIHKDSTIFVSWAENVSIKRGLKQIDDSTQGFVDYGLSAYGLGKAEGDGQTVVSLGDRGEALLYFAKAIKNEAGPDFAVFENGFANDYLELAFVEVSNDGLTYYRFPAYSETPSNVQSSNASYTDTRYVHNLAGKYKAGYGTPFDLSDLDSISSLDLDQIHYVKLIDVVGNIDPQFASYDCQGRIINDPWPTNFGSGGFDLDAIGVIHQQIEAGVEVSEIVNSFVNPIQDRLLVDMRQDVDYQLVTMGGAVVHSGSFHSGHNEIQVSEIPSSAYYLLLTTSNGQIAHVKIQKQ